MSTKDNPESSRVWRFFEVSSYLMPPANVLILAGLIFVLITGDFGGRKAAMDHIEETPTIKLGDHIDAAPFSLTVHQALWISDVSPLIAGVGNKAFFAVRATVVNTASQPVPTHVFTGSLAWAAPREVPHSRMDSTDPTKYDTAVTNYRASRYPTNPARVVVPRKNKE